MNKKRAERGGGSNPLTLLLRTGWGAPGWCLSDPRPVAAGTRVGRCRDCDCARQMRGCAWRHAPSLGLQCPLPRCVASPSSRQSALPPPTRSFSSSLYLSSIVNAEILALLTIPLTATTMARGVGYAEWLPWQAGAAPALLTLGGLGFKYIKEALDWQEDE